MSVNDIVTDYVILNNNAHGAVKDFLKKLSEMRDIRCYNILNNLIIYHRLISYDVTYKKASENIFTSAVNHYNLLFNAEILNDDKHTVRVNDIKNYDEFRDIVKKMKSLKLAFSAAVKNLFPVEMSTFHKIYSETVTSNVDELVTNIDRDTGTFLYNYFFIVF